VILPFLGVFVYIVARGNSMTQRSVAIAQEQQMAFDSYVRETAGTTSAADELAKLAKLKEQGILTDAEFAAKKQQLLA
jgi:hypothetical protein